MQYIPGICRRCGIGSFRRFLLFLSVRFTFPHPIRLGRRKSKQGPRRVGDNAVSCCLCKHAESQVNPIRLSLTAIPTQPHRIKRTKCRQLVQSRKSRIVSPTAPTPSCVTDWSLFRAEHAYCSVEPKEGAVVILSPCGTFWHGI